MGRQGPYLRRLGFSRKSLGKNIRKFETKFEDFVFVMGARAPGVGRAGPLALGRLGSAARGRAWVSPRRPPSKELPQGQKHRDTWTETRNTTHTHIQTHTHTPKNQKTTLRHRDTETQRHRDTERDGETERRRDQTDRETNRQERRTHETVKTMFH